MTEQRKEIPWFENKYRVSNMGRVKSKYWIMKFEHNHHGYPRIKFYGKWGKKDRHCYLVHRLVYNVFNNLPMEYNYKNLICHKDNNPKNARLDNLFIGTYSDNMSQCRDEWRLVVPAYKGEKNAKAKLKDEDIPKILDLINGGTPQNHIAKLYWVSDSVINSIYKWRSRKHLTSNY